MVRLLGVSNIGLRAWLAIGMTVMAFVAVFGGQLLASHHSNACDPGLERFKYLQSDPAIQTKPAHAVLEWEWDQPDNELLGCGYTYITYTMVGFNNHAIYEEANAAFNNHGWSQDPIIPGTNFRFHERQSPYGKLEAIISEEASWVRVTMNDLGGHAPRP